MKALSAAAITAGLFLDKYQLESRESLYHMYWMVVDLLVNQLG